MMGDVVSGAAVTNLLNVRTGEEIRECTSVEEAVLWCYRHDFGASALGPLSMDDPHAEANVGFAVPHFEDYLRLLLKHPGSFDIPAYARVLYAQMVAEAETLPRQSDGDLVWEDWLQYIARFRPA